MLAPLSGKDNGVRGYEREIRGNAREWGKVMLRSWEQIIKGHGYWTKRVWTLSQILHLGSYKHMEDSDETAMHSEPDLSGKEVMCLHVPQSSSTEGRQICHQDFS